MKEKIRVMIGAFLLLGLVSYFGLFGQTFNLSKAQGSYDQIETYGTINSASIKIRPIPTEVTKANLFYRKQGTSQWKQGLDPVITVANHFLEDGPVGIDKNTDPELFSTGHLYVIAEEKAPMIRRLHGSIMYLDPSTTYEIKVELKRSDGSVYDTITSQVATWADQYPFGQPGSSGRTLYVSNNAGDYSSINSALDAADPGDIIVVRPGTYSYNIQVTPERSGEDGRPITIKGYGAKLEDPNGSVRDCIRFYPGAHDVIIEGFEIGVFNTSVHVYFDGANISRIILQNNKIDLTGTAGPSIRKTIAGVTENMNKILIQNNTVLSTNTDNGFTIYLTHTGVGARGVVIRNNYFKVGSCQDVAGFREGPREDFDIYNNYFEGQPSDDGIELEGGININVRFWNNTVNNVAGTKGTISHTPVVVGPIYVFRNVLYTSPQAYKIASNAVQDAQSTCNLPSAYRLADLGPVFWYHNTIYHNPGDFSNFQFFRYPHVLEQTNIILKNNIIYGSKLFDGTNMYLLPHPLDVDRYNTECGTANSGYRWGQINSDYNIWWDGSTTTCPNSSDRSKPDDQCGHGLDLHSVFADPKFISASWPNPDLKLSSTSPAIDKGVILPNINDNYSGSAPDLGAFEYGQSGITLSKSVDKSSAQVGDILTYSITYQNISGGGLTNAKIEDPIPSGTTYVNGSATSGGTFDGTKVIWNLGNLDPGASGSVQFQVRVE